MGVRIGPFDPIQLIFTILNSLMKRGIITYEEAREIIRESLDPQIPEEEKEKLLDSIITRT